jgi:hypothetical protein
MNLDAMRQALEALRDYHKSDDDRLSVAMSILGLAIEQAERQELVCEYCGGDRFIAPPQRQPLTDAEMLEILVGIDAETKRLPPGMKAFARAIERAYGIGGGE